MRKRPKPTKAQIEAFQNRPAILNAKRTAEQVYKMAEDALAPVKDVLKNIELSRESSKFHNSFYLVKKPEVETLNEVREIKKLMSNRKKYVQDNASEFSLTYNKEKCILSRKIEGKTFKYEMKRGGKTTRIFEELLKKGKYIPTPELQVIADSENLAAVRKSIGDFNNDSGYNLNLKKTKIIQGKTGLGYRINPIIHIEKI